MFRLRRNSPRKHSFLESPRRVPQDAKFFAFIRIRKGDATAHRAVASWETLSRGFPMRRLTPHLCNLLSANQFFDTLPGPADIPQGRDAFGPPCPFVLRKCGPPAFLPCGKHAAGEYQAARRYGSRRGRGIRDGASLHRGKTADILRGICCVPEKDVLKWIYM